MYGTEIGTTPHDFTRETRDFLLVVLFLTPLQAAGEEYAFRGYLGLQRVDRALLEPRLPPQVFYNLMIAARKP